MTAVSGFVMGFLHDAIPERVLALIQEQKF
jgi:hypothetical protein